MLKIIEGTRIKIQDLTDPFSEEMQNFDTKNITIIFLGAFSGLDKIRDKRLNKNPLGFVNNPNQEANVQKSRFLKQDLVEYGMPEEFVGRIDTIIEMNKLTKQDLAVILRKSKLSIFRKYQAALREKEYLQETVKIVERERNFLMTELKNAGIIVYPSEANFLLLRCDLPLDELLIRERIAIRNCGNFEGLNENYYRIAVRNHRENTALISAVRRVLGG